MSDQLIVLLVIDLFFFYETEETNGGEKNPKVICSLGQRVATESPSTQIIAKILITDDRAT